ARSALKCSRRCRADLCSDAALQRKGTAKRCFFYVWTRPYSGHAKVVAMSAVAKHQSRAPTGTPKPSPAALNAAAASFAALTARLDYLSPEDTELVRRAYRFADEA